MLSWALLIILATSLFLGTRVSNEKQNASAKIKEASTHEEATSIRIKTKKNLCRWSRVGVISTVIIFLVVIGWTLILRSALNSAVHSTLGQEPENDIEAAIFFLLLIILVVLAFILYQRGYYDFLTGHIQTVTYEEFVRQADVPPFVLYLRSFNSYYYCEKRSFLKGIKGGFSEYLLSKELKKVDLDCYAVGITSELDSPYGANRIYCDFDNWRNQVVDMVERSSMVFIVMDDRDSCIWEIETCKQGLRNDKTIFYLSDRNSYDLVSKRTELPAVAQTQSFPCLLFLGRWVYCDRNNLYPGIVKEIMLPNIRPQ